MPIFLSRKALAEAWVTSGRKLSEMPENIAVMDLGVLVAQMQTDAFNWPTVHVVCERRSVSLVRESKEMAASVEALGLAEARAAPSPARSSSSDEGWVNVAPPEAPPPLTQDDDAPPPLH